MWLLGVVAVLYGIYQIVVEKMEKPQDPKDYVNFNLYREDCMKLSEEEVEKNVKDGKYRDTEELKKQREEMEEINKKVNELLKDYL